MHAPKTIYTHFEFENKTRHNFICDALLANKEICQYSEITPIYRQ